MDIKILNAGSDQCYLKPGSFFRDTMTFFSTLYNDEVIKWGQSGKILALTNQDLEGIDDIEWEETNIICAETCQQVYDYSYKLDPSKAYILLTESWIDIDHLKEKFYGIPIIGHYPVFNEIFNYGNELFQPKSYMSTLAEPPSDPEHDFFCLIGRRTKLREKFIYGLKKIDLSNSLVKFNGHLVEPSGAPAELDILDYQSGFFTTHNFDYGMRLPSKLIQSSLYDNFKFEVQFETDSLGGNGWDLIEYHVTEKTLKPLIVGKPCLMFGPENYNKWLSTVGIDLGHGNFDFSYDGISDDKHRVDALTAYLKSVDYSLVKPNKESHDKNMLGFFKLCDQSKKTCVDLYHKLRLIAS